MTSLINSKETSICEYVWIGGNGETRSKTRVLQQTITSINDVPVWNFDGSSTEQAPSVGNTEVIIKPCLLVKDPLRKIDNCKCYVVLCDTYDDNDVPLSSNKRHPANEKFNKKLEEEPWFGLEQEYFFNHHKITRHTVKKDGLYYCGITEDTSERLIVEKHLIACLEAGLNISGMNAEVVRGQWEFQIGPCVGIESGDHLTLARYFLEKIAETHDASIIYCSKPFPGVNGSGCHINFSTRSMREPDGLLVIDSCMPKLQKRIKEHMLVYGYGNEDRLTGTHETSAANEFSDGIGTRNTSVRIGNQTAKDGYGYFEDRRPGSNIDPYAATAVLFETCCLDDI